MAAMGDRNAAKAGVISSLALTRSETFRDAKRFHIFNTPSYRCIDASDYKTVAAALPTYRAKGNELWSILVRFGVSIEKCGRALEQKG